MILIALLGQTSSGKSDMAVDLANFLGDSWIVNCDSRQIYKHLNIGTGKVPGKWAITSLLGPFNQVFFYRGVPHFLIDFVEPEKYYNLALYIQDWLDLFQNIIEIGVDSTIKPPKYIILTGGTGLYAKAVIEKYQLGLIKPEFQPNYDELLKKLRMLTLNDLQKLYFQLPEQNQTLNQSDKNNSRRLVNTLLKNQSQLNNWQTFMEYPKFEKTYVFGIKVDQNQLKSKIQTRLDDRLNQGMLDEVRDLHIGSDRLLALGLEYRMCYLYLSHQIGYADFANLLFKDIFAYSKRQLTWLKKQDLVWIENLKEITDILEA